VTLNTKSEFIVPAPSTDVLHVVPAFYPTRGGIEVLVENLTEQLNIESGRTHAVLAPRVEGESPDQFIMGNTQVFSVDTPDPEVIRLHNSGIKQIADEHLELARILLRTRSLITAIKPQIIHLHGLSVVGTAASVVAGSLNIPLVMHLHGSVYGALSLHMKTGICTATTVLAVSDFVKESIALETGRVGEVRVIRNGLPDSRTQFTHKQPVVAHTHPTINMIGRLEESKGFDDGLRACAPLISSFPKIRVNIVGVGFEDARLRELARSLGIAGNVDFRGRLEREETLDLINDGTLTLVPSLAYEGFSLVALESAFLEKPIVVNRIGGLSETVLDGTTGTVVNPGDIPAMTFAISKYLDNPDLARTHGANARVRALTEFTLQRMSAQIAEVHNEILANLPDPGI
jgi:glycosyltransferase involved in cell wall biosynthesis